VLATSLPSEFAALVALHLEAHLVVFFFRCSLNSAVLVSVVMLFWTRWCLRPVSMDPAFIGTAWCG
jgi:hypothetical protein